MTVLNTQLSYHPISLALDSNTSHHMIMIAQLILLISFLGTANSIANPAATFCANNGGTSFSVIDETGGIQSYCEFDIGIIEQWTLFRSVSGQPQDAVKSYLKAKKDIKISTRTCVCLLYKYGMVTGPALTIGIMLWVFGNLFLDCFIFSQNNYKRIWRLNAHVSHW